MDTESEKEFEKQIEKQIEEKIDGWCSRSNTKNATHNGSAGAVWFLGFIGAAVYFIQHSDGFWTGVLGVLKALVWPAFLVYEAMKALGM
ncbi:MAG: hypothetical protein WC828_00035 [Thermoleophilia bacterium]|jgi:hypothetical protein